MSNATRMFLFAAAISAMSAAPALAKKETSPGPKAAAGKQHEVPPGLLIAMQKAFPQVGHGADVPRGKGKGWGHLHHDHEGTPVSP